LTVLADTRFVESTGVWIIKSLVIFGFVLGVVPLILLLERKLLGRFQNRYGPNRVGPYGLLQPLADVLKLLGKEQSHPSTGVPVLMAIAPAIAITTAVASLAIIPFGDVKHGLGAKYGLYGIDVNIGILYAFAFGSLAFYALLLGGWASGSKYSFLGAMRSAAQLISYEVSLTLALLGVIMMAGSLSLVDIVQAQGSVWYVIPQFVGFLIFLVSGFAETNRPPFDLPEADAELVSGYNTEFGGMRFGSFFMAEYMNMIVISGLASAIFLGGWMGPGPGFLDPLWMALKMFFFVCLFIWVRATLPRLRYDQLMSFGWKVLLPLATLNLLVTAVIVTLTS
jgi:NADH-quinone oxidoreductase subunit H